MYRGLLLSEQANLGDGALANPSSQYTSSWLRERELDTSELNVENKVGFKRAGPLEYQKLRQCCQD